MADLILSSSLKEKFSNVIRENINYVALGPGLSVSDDYLDPFNSEFGLLCGNVGMLNTLWSSSLYKESARTKNDLTAGGGNEPLLVFNYRDGQTPRFFHLYKVTTTGNAMVTDKQIQSSLSYFGKRYIRIDRGDNITASSVTGVVFLKALEIKFKGNGE